LYIVFLSLIIMQFTARHHINGIEVYINGEEIKVCTRIFMLSTYMNMQTMNRQYTYTLMCVSYVYLAYSLNPRVGSNVYSKDHSSKMKSW